MIILKSEIDCLFLHAWIKYHKLTIEQLQLKPAKKTCQVQKHEITCDIVLTQLHNDYQSYKESKKSVKDFLNIDILIFRENSQGHFNAVKSQCLDRQIIVLCQKRQSGVYILDGVPLSELRSVHPIEMSIKSLLSIYDIAESIKLLPFEEMNIYKFEDKFKVCIDIYKRNGNMCQKYYNIPGNRDPSWTPKYRIKVGVDNLEIPYLPKFFWIPCDSLVHKTMFCSKLPGICGYSTTIPQHLADHEGSCSDQTTVESKQVRLLFMY